MVCVDMGGVCEQIAPSSCACFCYSVPCLAHPMLLCVGFWGIHGYLPVSFVRHTALDVSAYVSTPSLYSCCGSSHCVFGQKWHPVFDQKWHPVGVHWMLLLLRQLLC